MKGGRYAEMTDHLAQMRERVVVVLYRPQNVVNIGGVVRAMKNMGVGALRLIEPVPFCADDILRVAHRSEDVLAQAHTYTDLDTALEDTIYVVGTTERQQGQHPIQHDVATCAATIIERTYTGPVALLFGSEDNGLSLAALDRCHAVIRLPSDPAYPSLNLAQAVLLLLYELRRHAADPPPTMLSSQPPATTASYETLFATCQKALQAIEFFKTGQSEQTMRHLRTVLFRASLDQHEVALLTAMAREVINFVRRHRLK